MCAARSTVPFPRAIRGTSMIEVLITIVIIAIGLLGLAGLQARLQVSEMEAYQRAQALILLNDMASRIAANRANAEAYLVDADAPVGVGFMGDLNVPCSGMINDLNEWCNALRGAGETSDAGPVGAMVGGRGCVEKVEGIAGEAVGEYLVTVAWQGLTPISAPPDEVACGAGAYDGGNCAGDLCRRTVTTIVRVADLSS